jgi:hypothetical protein
MTCHFYDMGEEEAVIRPYQSFKFMSPMANRRFFPLQHLLALSLVVTFCGMRFGCETPPYLLNPFSMPALSTALKIMDV